MAVSGNLAGQPITLDNAASEQTLLRIEQIMASQASGPDGAAAKQAAATAAQNFAQEAGRAGVDLRDVGAGAGTAATGLFSLNRAAGQFKRATDSAIRATQGFGASLSNQQPFAMAEQMISVGAQGVGGAFDAMASKIPVVGSALGGLAKAGVVVAGAMLGAFVGAIKKTSEEFTKVQKAGGLFGGDLLVFRDAANQAGLQMSQYNAVIARAGEAMASFGGTTTKGAKEFAQANSAFIGGYSDQMLRMGIDYEDMGVRTAEYMETLQLSGTALGKVGVTSGDVAAGAARLAKQQKMLAAMNGESIESQKQRQKQARTDAAFQASLSGMNDKQRTEMEALITQFPHLSQAIKETIVTGDAVSAEAIMAVQAAGTQGNIILEGVRNITEGVNPEEQVTGIMRSLEANADVIAAETRDAAETVKLGILGVNSQFVNAYTEQFLPLQNTAVKAGANTFSNIEEDMNNMQGAASKATENVIKIQQDFQRASIELSSAVTNILDSDFGGKVTDLIALPTQILADVAGGINSATMSGFLQEIGLEEGPRGPTPVQMGGRAGEFATVPTTAGFTGPDDGTRGTPDSSGAMGGDPSMDESAGMAPVATTNRDPQETTDPGVLGAVNGLKKAIDNQTNQLVSAIQNM